MKPEMFFLRYAFPCAFIIFQRKEITKRELTELENAAVNNVVLPKEKLEKIFHRAFNRIKPIAVEMNKDRWNIEVIKEYFLNRHTELAEQGFEMTKKVPRTLKELCKIHKAVITDKKRSLLVVKFNKSTRTVLNSLVPNAKIGDLVNIHYGYAVEIVT